MRRGFRASMLNKAAVRRRKRTSNEWENHTFTHSTSKSASSLPFNSISKKSSALSKKGFSISDQTFLASGVPREEDGGGDLSTAPTLVSPVIPKIHSFRPQNSSGSLEGKSGRARILMVPPLTPTGPTGYERNTFSCIASTSSTPIR